MQPIDAGSESQPPAAPLPWAGQPVWHELEIGVGMGLNFLQCWQAWRNDAQRPGHLFYTAVDSAPITDSELLRAVASVDGLSDLAQTLAPRWRALLPGVHRFAFDKERVVLTLCVGQAMDWLPTLDAAVDGIRLASVPLESGSLGREQGLARALARLCRPGSSLRGSGANPEFLAALSAAGFQQNTDTNAGLMAVFAPRWQPRSALRPRVAGSGRHAVVVGGGLSGSAVAWSLAQRGWTVELLDQATESATGASALPAGLVAPHVSPDDAALSRLTRAGVRLTLQRAADLLREGEDWAPSGVLEHQIEGKHSLPRSEAWRQVGLQSSRAAYPDELANAGLPPDAQALWHGLAGWLRPARLVSAQLAHPNIQWRGDCKVATLEPLSKGGWRLLNADGAELTRAEQVVIASAYDTRALLQRSGLASPPLNPLRGQISWGAIDELPESVRALLPSMPVNGHGCFVSGTPGPDGRPAWIAGSTFERGASGADIKPEDQIANRDKLMRLLPALGTALAPAFDQAGAWAGLRCTLPDRVPAVGPLDPQAWPGLHVCAGMGARGLTLSVLSGELLAALLHGEPWPVERRLAQSLLAARFIKSAPRQTA